MTIQLKKCPNFVFQDYENYEIPKLQCIAQKCDERLQELKNCSNVSESEEVAKKTKDTMGKALATCAYKFQKWAKAASISDKKFTQVAFDYYRRAQIVFGKEYDLSWHLRKMHAESPSTSLEEKVSIFLQMAEDYVTGKYGKQASPAKAHKYYQKAAAFSSEFSKGNHGTKRTIEDLDITDLGRDPKTLSLDYDSMIDMI